MKPTLLIILITLFIGKTYSQDTEKPKINIGHIDKIYSDTLEQWREVFIALPKSYQKSENKTYPVLYLLDGESHFDYTAGMVKQLSSVNNNKLIPEMIVVGIKNINRWKDFTPEKDPFFKKVETGGLPKFTSFVENELMPHVSANYQASKDRLIIGHSLGGLFVIHTMIHSPHLFDYYLSIDPTLWWLSNKYLNIYLKQLDKIDYSNKKLYFAIANGLLPGTDINTIRQDTTMDSYHMRSMLTFQDDFYKSSTNKLSIESKFYKNENHGSLPLIATYDALRFFFRNEE